MRSYIKSELYRIIRNKWTYLFIAICTLLLVSANVLLATIKHAEPYFPYATTEFSLSNFYGSIAVVFLLCVSVASLVFGSEYSNHTMKNSISYGISRGSIYYGKLIVEIIYAIVAFVIITGIYVASSYLLLENSGPENLMLLLRTCFVSLPLFIFALAATNCFQFIFESSGAAISAVMGYILAFPIICNYLGMKFIIFQELAKIQPWNMLNRIRFDFKAHQLILPWEGTSGYYYFWLIGLSQMLFISLIGFFVYRRKEIK